MHNIRRQAKYNAWYSDPNEEPSLFKNPFGKYRAPTNTRSNTLDNQEKGESGLTKVVTDPHGGNFSKDAERRRLDLVGKPPPVRGDTVPANHSRLDHSSGVDSDIAAPPRSASPIPEDHERLSREFEDQPGKDSQSSDTVAAEDEKHPHHIKDLIHRKHDDNKHDEKGRENGINQVNTRDEDDNNGKEKKPKKKFTLMSQIRGTIFNSWINVLLIFSPIGIAVYYAHINPIAVFVINFIAIIPLAAMLSYATEEIALRTGETIGGLLNASFGNAVELIVSVIALTQDQFLIVQTSLIGSMLSNLLLVMGMCFFFGGFNRVEQAFNMTVAQTASSLLFLAVSALILPTAFEKFASSNKNLGVKSLSDGTAVMLLIVYGAYLFFQLKSHAAMYNAPSDKNKKRDLSKHTDKYRNKLRRKKKGKVAIGGSETGSRPNSPEDEENMKDQPEEPQLSVMTAIITLAASTVLVALNAEYLVDSINAITCGGSGISKNFVGLILLPIVGNAAEHATAVTVAVKDKMDLAIGVAVGSSMQIALLVLPFVVVLGWIMGKEMTLYFDPFQVIVLFVSVLLVNYLIQDGKSHWLEGVLLMTLYIVIAVAAWFYPASASEC